MRALRPLFLLAAVCALSMPVSARAAPARSWTAPSELAGPAGSVGAPQVGINELGESVAVWSVAYGAGAAVVRGAIRPQIVSAVEEVQVSIRPVGGSYGAVQTLSDPGASAFSASVGIDASGEAVAVWTQDQAGEKSIGEKSEIEFSTRPAGGTFGPAQLLSPPGVPAEQPSLVVNPAGEAVVSWLSEKDTELEYATRTGKSFGPTHSFTAKAPAGIDDAHAALDAHGNEILAWDEEEEPSAGIYLGRVVTAQAPAGGSFGAPVTLSEPGAHDFLPMVALDAEGNAALVWVGDTENAVTKKSSYQVLARTLSSGGAKGSLQSLSEAGQNPEDPNVGVAADGEATAAWTRSTSSSSKFEAAVLPAGESSFAPTSVLDEAAGGFLESAVDVNESGEAIAMWSHEAGSEGEQVEEAERAAGASFSAPVPVSSVGPGFVFPTVAIDSAGDAAAGWDASGHESISIEFSNFVLPTPPPGGTGASGGGSSSGASTGTSSNSLEASPLRVSLHARKSKLAKLLGGGALKVDCTLSAPGTCRIELSLAAKIARKLGFHIGRHAKAITIGVGSIAFTAAGTKTVSLKLSRAALRILEHSRPPLTVRVTASAHSASGASASAQPIVLVLH